MYVIPIIAIAALCAIGIAWSPIFALMIAVPAAILFFVFVGLSPRADETRKGAAGQEHVPQRDETEGGGFWGERRA
jgi:hypothetical protein